VLILRAFREYCAHCLDFLLKVETVQQQTMETATTIDDHVYECLNYTTTFLSLITSGEKDPRHLTKTLNATLLNGAYLKGYAYTVCKLSVDVNTEIYSGLLFSG